MCEWVLLRHDEPGGGHHFDWMFEVPGREELVTFRLAAVPSDSCFEGVRISDHRRIYLQYEGEVSGGRGRVARVAEGRLCARWTQGLVFHGVGGWLRAGEWWEGAGRDVGKEERWNFRRMPE